MKYSDKKIETGNSLQTLQSGCRYRCAYELTSPTLFIRNMGLNPIQATHGMEKYRWRLLTIVVLKDTNISFPPS